MSSITTSAQQPVITAKRRSRWRYVLNLLIFTLFAIWLVFQALGIFSAFVMVKGILHPQRHVFCCDTPASAGITYEDVSFPTQDGLNLSGWYFIQPGDAAIVMLHGQHGNRVALWSQAEELYKAGYSVLTFDLRAHGASDGEDYSQGWLDVLAAVDWLKSRGIEQIGIYGFSLGATMGVQAAAMSSDIDAVLADGLSPVMLSDVPLPNTLPGWLYASYDLVTWPLLESRSREHGGFALQSTHDAVAAIAPRPLFLIASGAEPSKFELNTVQSFYANAGENADLWVIPDVFHGGGYSAHPEEFTVRMTAFFDTALRPSA